MQLPAPLNQMVKDATLEQVIAAIAGVFVAGGLACGAN